MMVCKFIFMPVPVRYFCKFLFDYMNFNEANILWIFFSNLAQNLSTTFIPILWGFIYQSCKGKFRSMSNIIVGYSECHKIFIFWRMMYLFDIFWRDLVSMYTHLLDFNYFLNTKLEGNIHTKNKVNCLSYMCLSWLFPHEI